MALLVYYYVVTGQREGLLTYRHGTVCDDYFNYNAAHAICRVMGYAYATRWRHGQFYGSSQTRRRITMDDVRCRSSYWNYCSYRHSHNCRHYEDVFLTYYSPPCLHARRLARINRGSWL